MGHPGVVLRDLEASRDVLSRGRYHPQLTERRLSCSHRVTFLTGANRDFPNWRRQSCSGARGSVLPTNRQRLTAVSLGPRIRRVGLDTVLRFQTTATPQGSEATTSSYISASWGMRPARSALDGMTAAAPRSFKLARSQLLSKALSPIRASKSRPVINGSTPMLS